MTRLTARLSFADEHMLPRELDHRVNKEFAAAISVLSLAAARSGNNDVKIALTAATELLHEDIFPENQHSGVSVIWQYIGLSMPEMEQRVRTYSQYSMSANVSGFKDLEAQTSAFLLDANP